jgi:hypothetical protein
MKVVLMHGISMEEMSRSLQKKSVLMLQGKNILEEEDENVHFEVLDEFGSYHVEEKISKSWKKIVSGEGLLLLGKLKYFLKFE